MIIIKFVLISGPQAVGKMTVGQELSKITQLHLMHNHHMIEPVLEIFKGFNIKTILELREVIFNNFLETDNYGMIFTQCTVLNSKISCEATEKMFTKFKNAGAEIYFVHLEASEDVRMKRNETENRLKNKKSKQNTERSKMYLLSDRDNIYEYEDGTIPFGDFIKPENYIRINNENLEAEEVAKIIKEKFNFV